MPSCLIWRYLGQTVWPARLAVFYPFPEQMPCVGGALVRAAALVGITLVVARVFRRAPFLLVGWLWYLGTLVPVIGLVQVGEQAHADRYTYVPLVGIFIMLAWSAAAACAAMAGYEMGDLRSAGRGLRACLVLTTMQVRYWKDSESLFQHAIEVTQGNYVAYNNLGVMERERHRLTQAIADYREALRDPPVVVGSAQ